jgi:hypothetical protein
MNRMAATRETHSKGLRDAGFTDSQAETFADIIAQVDRTVVSPKRPVSPGEAHRAAPGTGFLRWFVLLLLARTVLIVSLVKLLP